MEKFYSKQELIHRLGYRPYDLHEAEFIDHFLERNGRLFLNKENSKVYDDNYRCYAPEEWKYPPGIRLPEWDACSLQEAIDFIDSYGQ
ncbi:hypothetical protein P22_1944 [Propionispora sp. 2/2-37]|uniref:hypothetical protein n=1 Tax=Propionispora sp. 2/2-37 TaxID=1677858 RepID=UPI0006BB895C|nr:hypothetical protein [Propionispora sp. 2/2-37]CUH95858.1 hypothetical protein P22_1944 [Propionispora sp. 2/2-37]